MISVMIRVGCWVGWPTVKLIGQCSKLVKPIIVQ